MAQAGDTVLLHGGTYHTSTLGLYGAMTSALPVTLQSAPGEWAVLDGSNAAADTPIFYIQGSGYQIRSLEIANARKSAISIDGGHDLVIADCVVRDSIGGAVYPYNGAHHLRIERNDFHHNIRSNQPTPRPDGGWPSAVNLSDHDDVVTDNLIHENWGEGMGIYGQRHRVARNRLHDNYSVDLYANNLVDSEVSANFVYTRGLADYFRFGSAAIGIDLAAESGTDPNGFSNNRVVNNLVTGARRRCLGQWNGFGNRPAQNSLVAFNTLVCAATEGTMVFDDGPHTGVVVRNNVLVQSLPGSPLIALGTSPAITFDHNARWGGQTIPGAAMGAGDITADPRLRCAASGTRNGLRLRADSPLRDAALPDASVATDADGAQRVSGSAPDIGALEYPVDTLLYADFDC
ncbi:right-handed parallel beta-helix repeat-containing protein [Tahibacter amnicola]|uniref:Right-handed parallel beta-helix repeat-containing protein n=1 Tax=Tahibacter amnicola TaxID=2976241 RepID=A0ABY6B7G2_9GAMM|nr:right-handed parallel beta-helix repeat-containing protein [Tahibacter amnicola]UXI65835.1 right-handed parallel beta-helix repeat-containing protein [Tahibacter amnicola]